MFRRRQVDGEVWQYEFGGGVACGDQQAEAQ